MVRLDTSAKVDKGISIWLKRANGWISPVASGGRFHSIDGADWRLWKKTTPSRGGVGFVFVAFLQWSECGDCDYYISDCSVSYCRCCGAPRGEMRIIHHRPVGCQVTGEPPVVDWRRFSSFLWVVHAVGSERAGRLSTDFNWLHSLAAYSLHWRPLRRSLPIHCGRRVRPPPICIDYWWSPCVWSKVFHSRRRIFFHLKKNGSIFIKKKTIECV